MSEDTIQAELLKVETVALSNKRVSTWNLVFSGVCAICAAMAVIGSTYKFAGDQAKQDQTTNNNVTDIVELKKVVLGLQLDMAEIKGRVQYMSPGYIDSPDVSRKRAEFKSRLERLEGKL